MLNNLRRSPFLSLDHQALHNKAASGTDCRRGCVSGALLPRTCCKGPSPPQLSSSGTAFAGRPEQGVVSVTNFRKDSRRRTEVLYLSNPSQFWRKFEFDLDQSFGSAFIGTGIKYATQDGFVPVFKRYATRFVSNTDPDPGNKHIFSEAIR